MNDDPQGTRALTARDAKSLAPGAAHYTAYVGPPDQFDLMGATQFRLLCTLGLREHHRLLDFGCGSLRAGRLFIPYLLPGHYSGLEPNRWLVEDAVEREVGADLLRIKRPVLLHHDTFTCGEFGTTFDYVLAQSIFSHCGRDLVARVLGEFAACMSDDAIAAVTFVHAADPAAECRDSGWIYPGIVRYQLATIAALLRDAGFHATAIPWHHPRQTWYVLSKNPSRVPGERDFPALRGAVLFDPAFAGI